jgi:hypothetical protein
MLDEEQASQIVVDCIRAVSHVSTVDLTGTLDDAGIVDSTRVNNMVTLIVNSKNIGVPSKQHRIDAGFFLGVDSSTAVFDVIDIVMDKSVAVSESPLEDFAALVAKHLAAHMAASTNKPNRKSARKTAKKSARSSKGKKGTK